MSRGGATELYAPCGCAALRRAARVTTQLYDLVLQPCGLKATQFFALRSIGEAGEIAQWRFARENAIAVETLSRRFAALRKRGLITSRIGEKHGERIYSLTEKGKEALLQALPYWERAQSRLRQTIGDTDWKTLLTLCDRTVAAAHEAEQLRTRNSKTEYAEEKVPDEQQPNHACTSDSTVPAREIVPT